MKPPIILRLLLPVIILILLSLCTREIKETKIPVTTDSESALALYKEAITASEQVKINKAADLFKQALADDPDFFMAGYNLATFYLYFGNDEEFQKVAQQTVQSEAELSEGEELLKNMLEMWVTNPKADVTENGEKLVEMYPEDYLAYYQLAFAQMIIDDYAGAVENLKKALEVAENKAPIYNSLGYAYMELEQYDEAEAVFDKYIELEPDQPNPYDSKGDFYMRIEEYGKAYKSYMKAHDIDTLWSYNKAMNAKALHDSLQVELE